MQDNLQAQPPGEKGGGTNTDFAKTMRLVRAFRIFRLFGKLKSLRQMVTYTLHPAP